jgi:hypothetical protein
MATIGRTGIEVGFVLDRQWRLMRGEMDGTKEPALLALAAALDRAGVPYAIIGGVALQAHQSDPRTTIDIDVAVPDLDALPREALSEAGFRHTGRFVFSDNWVGPDDVPVQFTGDPPFHDAIDRAVEVLVAGQPVRVINRADLLHAKLRAGSDPARRRTKRMQDILDAHVLIDEHPELEVELTNAERAILQPPPF